MLGTKSAFSVELTRIDRLKDTYSLDIRRLKGNLRSYKFLYDTIREYESGSSEIGYRRAPIPDLSALTFVFFSIIIVRNFLPPHTLVIPFNQCFICPNICSIAPFHAPELPEPLFKKPNLHHPILFHHCRLLLSFFFCSIRLNLCI
ncbi:hypothetical protein EDC04DRAFT_220979 [Pisolithus marmoratus]|nr:hypothetical protein EDC04DRAFT_220979 [Pisolithus marmoratus]